MSARPDVTRTLILLRHGESEWNAKNLFTGWVDVDLPTRARPRLAAAVSCWASRSILPDVLHTSLLKRAISTANIALDAADRLWIPVKRSWRLNERHYGALQGKDKAQTLDEFGDEQFMLWRRSYDVPPPPLADDGEFSQVGDPRYADLRRAPPRTECLKDVLVRMLPYWYDPIVPDLRAGKHRAGRRARQLAAGPGQAPGRHQRRGHRRAQHPHRHPAGVRPRRRPPRRSAPAAPTSTRSRRRPPSRPSRTRAAEPGQASRRRAGWPVTR